jgi:dipeptidyl aminopeptidase/acylaminoacyl peptidase
MTIRRKNTGWFLATLVFALFLPLSVASAQGNGNGNGNGNGGGGGGGGNDPPLIGEVYFFHDDGVWSMNPDGTMLRRLPADDIEFSDQPSHERHGGERWFTDLEYPQLPAYPNGRGASTGAHKEIWAVSESDTRVFLFYEPDLEILSPPVWMPGDQSISFIAERWATDSNGDPTTVIEAGMYVADIDYDSAGTIVGTVPGSLGLVADLSSQLLAGPNGFSARSEVAGHSWSPLTMEFTFGVRLRAGDLSTEQIWIIDVLDPENPWLLNDDDGAGWPEWSPDGSRIGFASRRGTKFYNLHTGSTKLLRRTAQDSWGISHWSPDGSHFVVSAWNNFSATGYTGIYRFTNAVGGKTLLVDDSLCPDDNIAFNCDLITLGWRE